MNEWLSTNLPIIIFFVLGLGMLVLEAFLPGFGVPGMTGIALELGAIIFTWNIHGPMAALGMTLVIVAIIGITLSISLRSIARGKLSRSSIVLNEEETVERGYLAVEDTEVMLGKEGTTLTVLRPVGMAEFDGVRLDVSSEGDFIQAGTRVRINSVEGGKVIVRPV